MITFQLTFINIFNPGPHKSEREETLSDSKIVDYKIKHEDLDNDYETHL
jgi:hypothetical protein